MVARIALLALVAGCTPRPSHTIPVAVLVEGEPVPIAKTAVDGLELRALELPAPVAPPADDRAAAVARARAAYAKGEFDACHGELAKLDIVALLVAGDRAVAARALTFDAACAWGAMNRGAASAAAVRLASYGLELPDTPISPEIERVLGDAITAVGKQKRATLAITGESGARVAIDGRAGTCTLPCTIDLAPGDHVIAVDADGFEPAWRTVRIPDDKQVAIAQHVASARLAAQQWRARVGRGLPAADEIGARLLGELAGESRVAFVHRDGQLSGALVVEGKLVANATRERDDAPGLVRELAYDGGLLPRPALWQRPWFWIATTGAVAVIAGAVVAVTYQRPTETSVGFK